MEMPRCCSISIQSETACRWRLAAAHRAGQLDRAGVQQQLLGQRRLAGVGVRDDGKRPAPGDFARQRVRVAGQTAARRWEERRIGCHGRKRTADSVGTFAEMAVVAVMPL